MRSIARFILHRDYKAAPSYAAYAITGALAAKWAEPSMWSGWCGTGRLNHFMLCTLWFGITVLCALLERLGPRELRDNAMRFVLAGISPLAIPMLVHFV